MRARHPHFPTFLRLSAARDIPRRARHPQNVMLLHHYLLISDQDSFARSIVPNVLGRGDRLSMTANVFEALKVLREAKPDAVLVAVEENDKDAAVMCRTLRRKSKLPIVMLVNPATRDQVTRGYRLGADAHIEIPCDARVFRARVGALLRRYAVRTSIQNFPEKKVLP